MVRAESEQSRALCEFELIPIATPVDISRLDLLELVPVLEEVDMYVAEVGHA